jgi:hypothetical protein
MKKGAVSYGPPPLFIGPKHGPTNLSLLYSLPGGGERIPDWRELI